MPGPLYRVRQFVAAFRARPLDGEEWRLVRENLPGPAAVDLFKTMPPGDRRHAVNILQGLVARGYNAPPLLQAALLHDVAKNRLGLVHRSAVVLLNAVSRRLLPRLASADPTSWRYPFYLSLAHAELGARAAEKAGVDPRAVIIIRQHQDGQGMAQAAPEDAAAVELQEWQQALKSLDDRN